MSWGMIGRRRLLVCEVWVAISVALLVVWPLDYLHECAGSGNWA